MQRFPRLFESMKKLLSVVVPCYNEEQVLNSSIPRIEKAIADLQTSVGEADRSALTRFGGEELQIDYELIFVNDGSSDRTMEILRSHQKENLHIRIVNFARTSDTRLRQQPELTRATETPSC